MLYSLPMPITGKSEKIQEEGQEKDATTISFTNGAKEQLEELRKHFNSPDFTEVVKLGISLLQRIKDSEEEKKKEQSPDEQ